MMKPETLLSIRQRLDKGEDFAALAEEFSQDPGSKNKGGDLGWSNEGSFVPRFTQVMNSLDKGEISEPFKKPVWLAHYPGAGSSTAG